MASQVTEPQLLPADAVAVADPGGAGGGGAGGDGAGGDGAGGDGSRWPRTQFERQPRCGHRLGCGFGPDGVSHDVRPLPGVGLCMRPGAALLPLDGHGEQRGRNGVHHLSPLHPQLLLLPLRARRVLRPDNPPSYRLGILGPEIRPDGHSVSRLDGYLRPVHHSAPGWFVEPVGNVSLERSASRLLPVVRRGRALPVLSGLPVPVEVAEVDVHAAARADHVDQHRHRPLHRHRSSLQSGLSAWSVTTSTTSDRNGCGPAT